MKAATLIFLIFLALTSACSDDVSLVPQDAGTLDALADQTTADASVSDTADTADDDAENVDAAVDPGPTFRIADTRATYDIDSVGDELLVAAAAVVRQSTDRGVTWTETPFPGVHRVRAFSSGERLVWTSENAVHYLNDGAWSRSYVGITTHQIIAIARDSNTGRLYFIAQSNDAFRRPHFIESSADGGATWVREAEWRDGLPVAVFETSDGVRVLSDAGKLGIIGNGTVVFSNSVPYDSFYDTIDGGVNVDEVLFVMASQYVDDTKKRGRLYRSDDRGATWQTVWEGLSGDPFLHSLWGRTPNDIYFLIEKESFGETSVMHLKDDTVEEVFIADALYEISGFSNPAETLLVGSGGLYVSR